MNASGNTKCFHMLTLNVLYRWKLLAPYYPMPLPTACVWCAHIFVAKPNYFHGCLPVLNSDASTGCR